MFYQIVPLSICYFTCQSGFFGGFTNTHQTHWHILYRAFHIVYLASSVFKVSQLEICFMYWKCTSQSFIWGFYWGFRESFYFYKSESWNVNPTKPIANSLNNNILGRISIGSKNNRQTKTVMGKVMGFQNIFQTLTEACTCTACCLCSATSFCCPWSSPQGGLLCCGPLKWERELQAIS